MRYIKLVTKIPHPEDIKDYKKFDNFEARSMHGQLPVFWHKAKDFLVYDRWGNRFLDFTSGIAVSNTGHGNKEIIKGIKLFLNRPILHSYTFPTDIRYWFLRELVETCYPEGKAFLMSSGTEATECACKLMRLWGLKQNKNKLKIISFYDSMHGRTALAQQLKGIDDEWVGYKDPNIIHLPFPKPSSNFLEDITQNYYGNLNEIAGIILESYQGWSARFYPSNYINQIFDFAKVYNYLICFDEIQSGFGRTGKMFAYEHYLQPQKPDLICLGKGISSSLPLSAVIGRKDLLNIPEVGSMSSTHSANPLSCIAGLKNLLEIQRRNLIEETASKGKIVSNFFEQNVDKIMKNGWKINGEGLVWAIVTNTEEEATRIVLKCFKKGLLLIWTHRNSIKICPPLTIKKEALLEGLNIIKDAVNKKTYE